MKQVVVAEFSLSFNRIEDLQLIRSSFLRPAVAVAVVLEVVSFSSS